MSTNQIEIVARIVVLSLVFLSTLGIVKILELLHVM